MNARRGQALGSPAMQEMRARAERAAELSLEHRRATGELMVYHLDGWVVREHPGGRIERLAPVGEFRAEDHFPPGFEPPAPRSR